MSVALKKINQKVLIEITPDSAERKKISALAENLKKKVEAAVKERKIKATVRVEGSVAKDTWISREPDIDIFVQLPAAISREEFGKIALEIAKEATAGNRQVERFAEHPYLEAFVDDVRVNIVPCYRVGRGRWKSATDRTPYHTDFVKSMLNKKLRGEVRLLKRFTKGIGTYGAEIKIGGFSGYLCEVLVLNYGSFFNVLKAFAEAKGRQIIDYRGFYQKKERELELLFEEPLIIIDPIDEGRNAASAVRKEKLDELIAASRAFLETPHRRFFFPSKVEPFSAERVANLIIDRDSTIVFVKFGRVKAVSDILWGQLYKTQRALRNLLLQNGFVLLRDSVWSNESDINMLLYEVEHLQLPAVKKHLGPPLERAKESEDFIRKHIASPDTFSGPMLENGRWIVETRRKAVEADELLEQSLKDGGRQVGVAEEISKALRENFEILTDDVILNLYTTNSDFAEFLTNYYDGKPCWLKEA